MWVGRWLVFCSPFRWRVSDEISDLFLDLSGDMMLSFFFTLDHRFQRDFTPFHPDY